jgi:AP-3 complex subunit sigma
MIEAIFILNKLGLLRFIKIYSENENQVEQEELIKKVFNSMNQSKDTNIIYDFEYLGEKRKLVFRLFGTIYIAMILDDLENELAILDFLNVMMQVLDEIFKGVSELHLIINPEKIYLLVDEMISAGTVIETNKLEIISNYNDKLRDDENYKFFVNK